MPWTGVFPCAAVRGPMTWVGVSVAWRLLEQAHAAASGCRVKKFTRLNFAELATAYGWSISYADGFADGEAYKSRRQLPPAYLLWGFDEYSRGFQDGYRSDDASSD